jgi:calcium-dependent protein kinase
MAPQSLPESVAYGLAAAAPCYGSLLVRTKDVVMVTDTLSDVRIKYHVSPKPIGYGHYGVVRKCMQRETKEWYALKSIRKSKVGNIETLRREVEILQELDHPNVIKVIDIHEDEKFLHLITELCTGGELFDRIVSKSQSPEGKMSENDATKIITSILDTVRYCHAKNIVHRDLKPENFMFVTMEEGSSIKMIDFGRSRYDNRAHYGIMKTLVGTP